MPDSLFNSFYNNLITLCAVFMGNTKEQVEHICQWLADNIK